MPLSLFSLSLSLSLVTRCPHANLTSSHLVISEFNYHRDPTSNACVLFPSAEALSLDTESEQCPTSEDGTWYERTAYRKIPYSSCQGGDRPDRGKRHECSGRYQGAKKGSAFWWTIGLAPFAFAGLAGLWWIKKRDSGWVMLTYSEPASSL